MIPGGSDGKASAYNAGDRGSIPGSGRSPGGQNVNLLQYSWKIPWTEEPGGLQSIGILFSNQTPTHTHIHTPHPTLIVVVMLLSYAYSSQPHGLQHTRQASLSFTISQSLLNLMSIESMMPSNHHIL